MGCGDQIIKNYPYGSSVYPGTVGNCEDPISRAYDKGGMEPWWGAERRTNQNSGHMPPWLKGKEQENFDPFGQFEDRDHTIFECKKWEMDG